MPKEMYFEDFYVGQKMNSLGSYKVTAEEIKDFGQKYDPQPFHLDQAAGEGSFFKGLAASGWLTAAMDTSLAPVLTAVHNNPEYPWSVTELAQRAGLSRSAFAERFTRLLGQSPAAYITDRRLDRAAHLLRSTETQVSKIGQAVGYTSEAAFSRAFHRRFDQPPTRWRKAHAHTPRAADSTS